MYIDCISDAKNKTFNARLDATLLLTDCLKRTKVPLLDTDSMNHVTKMVKVGND